jgi:hypothetical protein
LTRTYGHSEFHPASVQAKIESMLPVERPGDASGGTPEGASPSGELPDHAGEEVSTEEAEELIDAAEVLRAEKTKYEAAEHAAWPEDLKNA